MNVYSYITRHLQPVIHTYWSVFAVWYKQPIKSYFTEGKSRLSPNQILPDLTVKLQYSAQASGSMRLKINLLISAHPVPAPVALHNKIIFETDF